MLFARTTQKESSGVAPYVPPCSKCGGRNLFPDYDGVYASAVDEFGRPWGCRDCAASSSTTTATTTHEEQRKRWESGRKRGL